METVEYAPGRNADLYGDLALPTVLFWHGKQANARRVVRSLAEMLAGHGLSVVVPDWNSHADDGGRGDLLRSTQFALKRMGHGADLVLVGWSLGGVAAAGLTIGAAEFKIPLAHTVCLAGAFMAVDPITGKHIPAELSTDADRSPFTLLHGVSDDVVPVSQSQTFASTLKRSKWPVTLVELPADHGSIAGARYEAGAEQYSAAEDAATMSVAAEVAARIAAVRVK